jgi:hypothetical protein
VNTFAKIVHVEGFTGNQVNFYSVQFDNRERNEFEDFIFRHLSNKKIEKQLKYLFKKLENYSLNGVREEVFRHEQAFHALPPKARYLDVEFKKMQLRLYCLYVLPGVVIFFNGGVKTKQKAQDCENVSKYFSEAKILTAKIDDMIKDKQISFDQNRSILTNTENIEIWLT